MSENLLTEAGTATRVIAFSGSEAVGKKTHARILARRAAPLIEFSSSVDRYDPRWAAIKENGVPDWWFRRASLEELTDVLACSYLTRAQTPRTAPIRCVDRGIPLLEATVAATVAVREKRDPARAAERAHELLEPFRADLRAVEETEYGILLLRAQDSAADPGHAALPSHGRALYQRCLEDQLRRLAAADRFGATVVVGDRPVIAVQDDVRRRLHAWNDAVPERALADVQVLALGGPSESGRNTAGEYLRTRRGYARLTMDYLLEEAGRRTPDGTGATSSDAVTRAELVTDSLDRYCTAHPFLDRVSIEPFPDDESAAALHRILGPQLRVIRPETPRENTESPRENAETPREIPEKPSATSAQGDTEHGDIVIRPRAGVTPAGTTAFPTPDWARLSLERRLDRIALDKVWTFRRPKPVPVDALGLPVRLQSYLSALMARLTGTPPLVDLLALTGSVARKKYQHGWSDLDVLVLAGQDRLSPLRRALAELEDELGGVRMGVTVLTQDEFRVGALPSRLMHVLTLSGMAPLWCSPDLDLPVPDAGTYLAASMRDGVQAAIGIRRQLLRDDPDMRTLYKSTALLAKIMLRMENGAEYPADDDAIVAFQRRASHGGSEWLTDVRHNQREAEEMAHVVLKSWLSTVAAPVEAV
ncbi:nucleotidyltransferase domain-containing protein [Streptomyces sp. NPDC003077]|uniref:nucleotidyltransferase domain-containing protein n=1 Tax=Streptomyces sp. NPDC003077 TaxID=3154443 RepID=UPI0033A73C51